MKTIPAVIALLVLAFIASGCASGSTVHPGTGAGSSMRADTNQ